MGCLNKVNNTTKENTTHNIQLITGRFFYTSKQITVDKAKHECLAMQYSHHAANEQLLSKITLLTGRHNSKQLNIYLGCPNLTILVVAVVGNTLHSIDISFKVILILLNNEENGESVVY